MAWTEDATDREYYAIKRKMRARLVKADRAGRLLQELLVIEREGMAYWREIQRKYPAPKGKGRATRNGKHKSAPRAVRSSKTR